MPAPSRVHRDKNPRDSGGGHTATPVPSCQFHPSPKLPKLNRQTLLQLLMDLRQFCLSSHKVRAAVRKILQDVRWINRLRPIYHRCRLSGKAWLLLRFGASRLYRLQDKILSRFFRNPNQIHIEDRRQQSCQRTLTDTDGKQQSLFSGGILGKRRCPFWVRKLPLK